MHNLSKNNKSLFTNQQNIIIRFRFWGIILLRVFKCWRVIFVVFIQIIVIIKKFGLGLGQFSRARSGPAGWPVLLPEPGEKKWWTLSWLTPTRGSVVRDPGERAVESGDLTRPSKDPDEHGSITDCSVQQRRSVWRGESRYGSAAWSNIIKGLIVFKKSWNQMKTLHPSW